MATPLTLYSSFVTSLNRDLRVCFIGDSFVAGVGDSTALGWVGRTTVAGLARGLNMTTYNLGIRRQTSLQIAARLPVEVPPRLSDAEDPRIVLSFGVNDTMSDNGMPRVDRGDTARALRKALEAAGPVRLFVVGPPAVSDERQNERILSTNQEIAEEAADLGIPFLSCFEATSSSPLWREQVKQGDGFHPDAPGYELLASIATEPILDWLDRPQ